jgi:hypothetical protein
LRIGRSTDAVIFLEPTIEAVPYDLHTILTDNSILSADLPKKRSGWTAGALQSTRRKLLRTRPLAGLSK